MVRRIPSAIPWFLSPENIAMRHSAAEALIVVAAFNVGTVAISKLDFIVVVMFLFCGCVELLGIISRLTEFWDQIFCFNLICCDGQTGLRQLYC